MKESSKFSFKLIKSYRWNSLFFKYWIKISVIIIIPIFSLISIVYIYQQNSSRKQLYSTYNNDHQKAVGYLTSLCNDINTIYLTISTDNNIVSYISAPDESFTVLEKNRHVNNLYKSINSFKSSHDYIDSIHICSLISEYVISNKAAGYAKNFIDNECFKKYFETGKTNFIIPTSYTINNVTTNNISFCYGINANNKTYGLLVINVLLDDVTSFLSYSFKQNYITDSNCNAIVLPSGTKKIDSDLIPYLKNNINSRYSQKKLILCSEIPVYGLKYLSVYYNKASKGIPFYVAMLIPITLLALIISLIFSFFFSMQFYKSITTIVSRLETSYKNDLSGNDLNEVDYITNRIFNLADKNKNIEQELVDKMAYLKKVQSMALQTQINPHFLFNTLGLVNIIIMNIVKEPNDAEHLITLTSDLLRYSLDTRRYIVTVKEELAALQKYIEIERIRFKNNFEVEWQIDPEANDCKIIKCLLQPIVEKAFKHGMHPLTVKIGKLSIQVTSNKKLLIIKIKNNGKKIPDEELCKIRKNIAENDLPETEHIGLSNVNHRIRLIYGEKYGCYISSNYNGTVVTLLFPNEKD